jgi:uncharacterized membrane protein YqjE
VSAVQDPAGEGPIARLLASASRFVATLLTTLRTRLELVTVELQLELRRLIAILMLGFALLFTGLITLVMASIALIVIFWDTHRLLAALLVAGGWFLGAIVLGIVLATKLKRGTGMLGGTLAELARDSERLRGES